MEWTTAFSSLFSGLPSASSATSLSQESLQGEIKAPRVLLVRLGHPHGHGLFRAACRRRGSRRVGITSGVCFIIAGASYAKFGIDYVTRLDWLCFWLALGGIIVWKLTANPLSAIIVVTITDLIAYVPTFRKGYVHPHEETLSLFVLETFKYLFGIAALENLNLTTPLYPLGMTLSNSIFVTMLLLRRKAVSS